jgi:hypothetical protein
MKGMFAKLHGRSVAELRERGRQWLDAQFHRVTLALVGPRPWPAEPLPMPAREWLGRRRSLPHLQAPRSAAELATALAHRQPGWMTEMRRSSDSLFVGHSSLLGLKDIEVGNPPLWHRDAVSGKLARRIHWCRIDYLDPTVVGDHKVLWEVNRHQYLLAPAMCWLVDRESAYLALVQAHIADWLEHNPPHVGVNWASSLEIAYRSISWTWLLWLLRDAPWEPSLLARMDGAMRAHGRHIERNLSTYFSPNTHLTGEALGLCYLSVTLPEAPESMRWWALGSSILETSLGRQVSADGVYFEQATQYQRYTAEIYLHYVLLAHASGHSAHEAVHVSLERQLEVLRSVADAGGRMPLIGDDDGGHLLPLDGRPPDDVAPLLEAGASLFGRPDLRANGRDALASAVWLLGTTALATEVGRSARPAWTDRCFPDGGLVTLRDGWGLQDAVAVLDAGPHGALNCGHAHADALGLTLSLGSQPLFIDRGTASYVGPERNPFRETASHNTLEFDHESSVQPLGPFKWGPVPPQPCVRLRQCGPVTIVEAMAEGHVATGRPSLHRRTVIRAAGGAWLITDAGERPHCKSGIIRWQLAPTLTASEALDGVVAIARPDGSIVAWLVSCGVLTLQVVTRNVSLRLRHQVPAQCIEVETGPALEAVTLILPAHPGNNAPTVGSEAAGYRIEWQDPARRHLMLLQSINGSDFACDGWTGQARLAWSAKSHGPHANRHVEPSWLVVIGATELTSPEGLALVEAPTLGHGITTVFQSTK